MHASDRQMTRTSSITRLAVLALAFAFLGCHGGTFTPDAKIDHVLSECTWPSCVTDLLTVCVPSGNCLASLDRTTGTLTTCSENGVTVQHTVTMSSTTWACKKDGDLSYTMEQKYRRTGDSMSFSFTLKNGAGTAVADGNASDSGIVITCTGGDTYALPATCDLPLAGTDMACGETASCKW
jgi:hypothetical protein